MIRLRVLYFIFIFLCCLVLADVRLPSTHKKKEVINAFIIVLSKECENDFNPLIEMTYVTSFL